MESGLGIICTGKRSSREARVRVGKTVTVQYKGGVRRLAGMKQKAKYYIHTYIVNLSTTWKAQIVSTEPAICNI